MPNLILGLFAMVALLAGWFVMAWFYRHLMGEYDLIVIRLENRVVELNNRIDLLLTKAGAPSGKPPRAFVPCDPASLRKRKKAKEDEKNSKMTRFERATTGK